MDSMIQPQQKPSDRRMPAPGIKELKSNLNAQQTCPNQKLALGLAPMDGVTDLPMRLWISLASLPDFAITPFFRVTPGYPLQKLPATYCPEALLQGREQANLLNRRVRPQLMGNSPTELARFSKHLLAWHESVDLNFGCPAPKIVGHNAGSGLIRCTKNLKCFLDDFFASVPPERTTIKTRLGFNCKSEAQAILETLDAFPLRELTLHGRTRAQKYTGRADWELIADLASQANCPVSVSGDICSFEHLNKLRLVFPRVRSVLIGRGAIRNPWLFHELRTCKKVELEWGCLTTSLRLFLLIHRVILENKQQELISQIRDIEESWKTRDEANQPTGIWPPTSSQESYWTALEETLLEHFPIADENSQHAKSSLTRLKMLWNFLRTSLPEAFMNPVLLRTRDQAEFFAFLKEIIQIQSESKQFLILNHFPQRDWIFSGERKTDDSA